MAEHDDEVPLVAHHHQRASAVQSQWSVVRKPLPPGTAFKYEELRGSPVTDVHSSFEKSTGIEDGERLAPKAFEQDPSWHKWYFRCCVPKLRKLRSTSYQWYKKNLSPTVNKMKSRWNECHWKYLAPTLYKLEPVWFGCQVKYVAPTLRKLELWWNEANSKYPVAKSQEKKMVVPQEKEMVALKW